MRGLHKQRGVTAIGWIIILGLIAFFALITIKLVPAYTEYFSVVTSLESVANERDLANQSRREIQKFIERRFSINDVESIAWQDVKVVKKGNVVEITADYEVRRPLFGNIAIVISFHKSVQG